MNSYDLQIAELAAVSCMLALGAYLSLSCGLMFICFGAVMSVGGIIAATAYSGGIPYLAALLLGGISAAILGGIVYLLCARLARFIFAVATLGLGELAHIVATNTEAFGGALGFKNIQPNPSSIYSFAILGLFLLAFAQFERSPLRTVLRIIRDNDVIASSFGINVGVHRFAAIVAASFIVGIAGGLYIHTVGLLDPQMFGFDNSVQILVFAIVGGTMTYVGPILGAGLLTILPEVLRFSASARMLLYGTVLVAVMVFRPEGLSASRRVIAK